MNSLRKRVTRLLKGSGVAIDGSAPWVLAEGSLGFGEAYMDEWWDCDQIDEMVARIQRADVQRRMRPSLGLAFDAIRAAFTNRQTKRRAFHVGKVHYDAGNDLYRAMLDARMTYTCGYWKGAATIDEAQEAKLDLVCRKIGLRSGQRVLDIGCGWGSFAKFAAERYGVSVVGMTVSKEQVKLGTELCHNLPVEIRLQDYRDVHGQFDHIVSLGMFEHVGYRNYPTYFKVVRRCLVDGGLFLLHTIGADHSRVSSTDPWIEKYIFPNSNLPSTAQITRASERLFVMEDWHNFSADYDKTLLVWLENVESHWNDLVPRYDERFHRMWRYYLLACAGTFRARKNQLWQITFSRNGVPGGYTSVR
jgi:cyclopropane-fatty-acyl-phospholipid synthase